GGQDARRGSEHAGQNADRRLTSAPPAGTGVNMYSKRQQLVGDLTDLIRSGRLAHGERLPGENQLALQYQVSRGTVRSALSELQRRNLISTETGVGSFVTFDGVALDQSVGWARALARTGSEVTVELLGIEPGGTAELTD